MSLISKSEYQSMYVTKNMRILRGLNGEHLPTMEEPLSSFSLVLT